MTLIPGHATPQGTERFMQRFTDSKYPFASYHKKLDLYFSTLGIGSYLGNPDEATDKAYEEAIVLAVQGGINVIDSAINYRCQRSEKSFGHGIQTLLREKKVQRDELIVCTKGGFIPFDEHYPEDAGAFIREKYIQSGILEEKDISQGCHAMTPAYLENQLEKSRQNLGLGTIDIYYLHNPETQLEDVERSEFLNRMKQAFVWAEEKVKEGKIRYYGTATWNGYRVDPESQDYLGLQELLILAREVGGAEHHFRAIQLPVNLAMLEAWVFPNQPFAANRVSLLGWTGRQEIAVIGSASLLQSRLSGKVPDIVDRSFPQLLSPAQKAIQFARSIPGMTCSLVGMKSTAHVEENLQVLATTPATESEIFRLFQS